MQTAGITIAKLDSFNEEEFSAEKIRQVGFRENKQRVSLLSASVDDLLSICALCLLFCFAFLPFLRSVC
jgi:hypothetical protein